MLWSNKRFLPSSNPIHSLPISDFNNTQLVYTLENLLSNLPSFIKDRCVREELVCQLREITSYYQHGCIDNLGGQPEYERVFLIFSFFANSYVNALEENVKPKIPKEIAIPLTRAAHLVLRKPVLDYSSYCLYNWKRKGDRFETLSSFSDSDDEKFLIESFLAMELSAGEILESRLDLIKINEILHSVVKNLVSSWEKIDKDNLKNFSCFYRGFKNVSYENSGLDLQSFPGNIFSHSPLIRLLYKILGISFLDEEIIKIENDITQLRPQEHTSLITLTASMRNRALKDKQYGRLYNEALDLLLNLSNYVFYSFFDEDIELNKKREEEVSSHFLSNVKVI